MLSKLLWMSVVIQWILRIPFYVKHCFDAILGAIVIPDGATGFIKFIAYGPFS